MRRVNNLIWFLIIMALLAVPVGKGFAIPGTYEEPPPPPPFRWAGPH